MATAKEIEALRSLVDSAKADAKRFEMDYHRAESELAAAEGREDDCHYHLDYIAAQMHMPGAHGRFMARCIRRDAQRILTGETTLDDFASWERPAIAAEVERMRSGPAVESTAGGEA